VRKPTAKRLRRRYTNERYPLVILRFEDGHEIQLKRGDGKTFDAYAGERVKIVVLWDPSANERELIGTLRAEEFEAASS
jgi:hypothetical protein